MSHFTISNHIFAFLHSVGVDRVFLVPGGGNMFLVDAAGTQTGIEVVPTHHEQSAVIAAEYYSRVSGKIGVALVTTGPGSTNAVTGVAGAWLDSIPILILAGQVKTADLNVGQKLRQKGPQEVDFVSMISKISKHSKTCTSADECVSQIARGVSIAVSGRPGPVVFEIPLDVQSKIVYTATSKEVDHTKLLSPIYSKKDTTLLRNIVENLVQSTRPILLVGNGARAARVDSKIKDFAVSSGIPISMTWPTMDLLPFEHELNAGRIGNVAKRFANMIIQKADLIIVLGSRLDPVLTAHNIDRFGHQAKVMVIDIEQPELDKLPKRFVKFCADLRYLTPNLIDYVAAHSLNFNFSNWCQEITDLKQKYANECFFNRTSDHHPISIYEFVECFSNRLYGEEIIVTGSSGLSVEVFHTHFKNKLNQRVFLTTGLGAMGYGLPALLGASEAAKQKVFLFESDGSLMMNLQELQSLKSRGRELVIFVMNNNGYASIRATQRNYFEGRLVATDPSSGLDVPKIEKIADCFGFKFFRIANFDKVNSSLNEVMSTSGAVICEVVLNSDEVLMPKCAVFRQEDNSLVSAPLEDMSPLLSLEELRTDMDGMVEVLSKEIRK